MVHMLRQRIKFRKKAANKVLNSFEQTPEEPRPHEFMIEQINVSLGLSEP